MPGGSGPEPVSCGPGRTWAPEPHVLVSFASCPRRMRKAPLPRVVTKLQAAAFSEDRLYDFMAQ